MSKLLQIESLLISKGLRLSGPLAMQDGDDSYLFAFIKVNKDSDGRQVPSNMMLKKIQKEISETNTSTNIRFILNHESEDSLEVGLRATLLHAFPNYVRNVFLSSDPVGIVAWIVPKSEEAKYSRDEIKRRCEVYFDNASIKFSDAKFTVDENLPSRTAILAELRIAAPAMSENLIERLVEKGFQAPPQSYVSRHLDALRKASLVVRRSDGSFSLTAKALKILGTHKRRNSPDIVRLLDLARRKN